MTETAQPDSAPTLPCESIGRRAPARLLPELLWLAIPVLAENTLHMGVGWTDTYLAGHLPTHSADATASIGLVTYIIWLLGLIAGAIGTGSTAIIARAVGAKHQRLANGVCGQSVVASVIAGIATTAIVILFRAR